MKFFSSSKGISNIYLKVTIEKKLTFSKLRFSRFKKFVSMSDFADLQLTHADIEF